jgi:Coenzyme PQQ synthesis protein D (PqqD)
MNGIDRSTMIKRAAHQVSCSLNDEVAILNLRSTLYFGLDEVGACVWQALEEPRRVDALCQAVAKNFAVSATACEADVLAFLATLQEAGLIEAVAG